MLKIFQVRLQQYVNHELPDIHVGFGKDRNGMDLTEAKILRRGSKNTQKNYTKKIFMT